MNYICIFRRQSFKICMIIAISAVNEIITGSADDNIIAIICVDYIVTGIADQYFSGIILLSNACIKIQTKQ